MSAFPTLITSTKLYLGITSTANDALIQLQTDLIVAEIEAFTDRYIAETVITEPLHYISSQNEIEFNPPLDIAVDYPCLFTKYSPVTNLVITRDGETVNTANYYLYSDNGVIQTYETLDDSNNKLVATYTAGYSIDTLPNALRNVIFEGVKVLFANSGTVKQGSGGISGKSIKDFSVNYGNGGNNAMYIQSQSGIVKSYIEANKTTLKRYMNVEL